MRGLLLDTVLAADLITGQSADAESGQYRDKPERPSEPAAGGGFAVPGSQPVPKASLALQTFEPAPAGRRAVELPHRRRHLPYLAASGRLVRIDFQNFEVGPNCIAEMAGAVKRSARERPTSR